MHLARLTNMRLISFPFAFSSAFEKMFSAELEEVASEAQFSIL